VRHLLLCSAIVLVPCLVSAEPQCVVPAPPAAVQRQAASAEDVTLPTVSALLDKPRLAGSAPVPVATGSLAIDHVAAAGAQLTEAGVSHGLRTVVARKDGQFMRLYVAPDGQALVTGLMSDLSVDELVSMTQGRLTELGTAHGLRGIFVPNGGQFQVFYATPDNQRVIPGAMFDAAGKDLTHGQVAPIPGAVPSVEIGDALPGTPQPARGTAASPLKAAESTFFGTAGPASAPRLWMFIDPLCAWSVRAMEQLRPHVASGQVQLPSLSQYDQAARALGGPLNQPVTGALELPVIVGGERPPSLEALQATRPGDTPESGLETGRAEVLRQSCAEYGAQGGLAARSFAINEMLRRYEPQLDSAYDFRTLVLPAGTGGRQTLLRPPIVTEAQMAFALGDGGQVARETSCIYQITRAAELTSAPPNWRTYLVRTWGKPPHPADAGLPRTRTEVALIGFRGGEASTGKQGWGPLVYEQKRE